MKTPAPEQANPAQQAIHDIQQGFEAQGYICEQNVAAAVFLALQLNKPILVEGPPGVGKTELAKTAALHLARPLIRLQCYEGLDETKAIYEWKYAKQLLYTQILKEQLQDVMQGARGLAESIERLHQYGDIFFSQDFLEPRALMKAIQSEQGAVLLIDEIDKADQEFESLLLEFLSDFQLSIPEIGTLSAQSIPLVVLTSNSTREMSDALKRRCLHLHIPFPDTSLETRIVASRVPQINTDLNRHLVQFIQQIRELDLKKLPAISETLDWANTLLLLHADTLDKDIVTDTLNIILKYQDDIDNVSKQLPKLLASLGE